MQGTVTLILQWIKLVLTNSMRFEVSGVLFYVPKDGLASKMRASKDSMIPSSMCLHRPPAKGLAQLKVCILVSRSRLKVHFST